jgi:hypothetical protein
MDFRGEAEHRRDAAIEVAERSSPHGRIRALEEKNKHLAEMLAACCALIVSENLTFPDARLIYYGYVDPPASIELWWRERRRVEH